MRTLRLWTVAALAAAVLGGCAAGGPPGAHSPAVLPAPEREVQPGTLFGADAAPLPLDELARRAGYADYVLVGEAHTSACDHRVQADVLEALTLAHGTAPVLGLEMVPRDLQPQLDRFNTGEIGPDELEEAVGWKDAWGHPYAVYKPLFQAARRAGAPLVALNVPKRVVRAVGGGGYPAVAAEDRALLPYEILPPSAAQVRALDAEFARHAAMMDADGIRERRERFLRVQSLWDTSMAQAAVRARRAHGRPVLIVAGSGHVERGWGIARRLARLDPRSAAYTVMPWRGGDTFDASEADAFFSCGMAHTSRLGFVLEERGGAVHVNAVAPDTRAAEAGFRAGDVITQVMGAPARDLWALHKGALTAGREQRPLDFTVRRDGETLSLSIILSGTADGEDATPAPPAE